MNRFDRLLYRVLERADSPIPENKLAQVISEAATEAGKVIAEALLESRFRMLIDHASLREGFAVRLRDPWGEPLDALYSLYVVAIEAAERHFDETRDEAVADQDFLWDALMRLQARACHVTSEIYALLRAGHAEAALARWRTLHELTVIAAFLKDHDETLARRFLEHEAITAWWDAQAYQRHAKRLQERPFTDAEMRTLARDRTRLLATYGKEYDQPWGWLVGVVANPSFAALESAAELDHWRPLYRDANAAMHGGPKRLSYRLGVEDAVRTWLTGPSNLGLQQPGIYTSISLSIATVNMLVHRANMEDLITARVVLELSGDANRAFGHAANLLDERIAEENEHEERLARRRARYRARRKETRGGKSKSSKP